MAELTFNDAMELTRSVSSSAAFEDPECSTYFTVLMSLPKGSLIVEVGLQFGRSSAIALQVAREHGLRYIGIDPFTDPPEAAEAWHKLAVESRCPNVRLLHTASNEAVIGEALNAILIDGDHRGAQVKADCEHFLPQVVSGGYALFHDFGRESLPEVYPTIMDYMTAHPEWSLVDHTGTLGVFQKS